MRCVAENASATEQVCGLDGDDRPDAADLVSLGERLTGLRVQWRELHDLEARLRSELHASGIEPEVVPKRAVRDIATARPSWRERPVTARQVQILERLEAETDATFPAGSTSTRGQAYDLIASLLAGNIPQAQIRDRLAGPLFMFGPDVAEERPDLVDATSDIPRARLAAELRGNIIPNLPALEAPDTSALFTDAGGYCALRLIDHVESELRYFPVLGWDYTLDGGASFTQCGHNARVATGAILEARDKPVPDWIERVYRPYAQADPTS
ncbi:hypothetical protein [Rhodococcus sp. 105337]|nr:hypothetical protein [Rhodococcus sp. 105337]NME81028.1 hypothetical protein [Rhodococcus sp. 105337]